MPPVGYVYDPLYLEHEMPGHPESPARLRAIMAHLEESGVLARLTAIEPRDATPGAEILWLALRVERGLGDRNAEASLGFQLRRNFPDSREARALMAGQYE